MAGRVGKSKATLLLESGGWIAKRERKGWCPNLFFKDRNQTTFFIQLSSISSCFHYFPIVLPAGD
jgi:hypothetical protein